MANIPRSVKDLLSKVGGLPAGPRGWVTVGEENVPVYFGLIGRIEPAGFGIILDFTGKEYPFRFDAIAHYRGQSAASLGLAVGQQVKFGLAADKVAFVESYVEPTSPSSVAPTTLSYS